MEISFTHYQKLPVMPRLPEGTFKLRVHPDLFFELKKAATVGKPLYGIEIEADILFPFDAMLAYIRNTETLDVSLCVLYMEREDDHEVQPTA